MKVCPIIALPLLHELLLLCFTHPCILGDISKEEKVALKLVSHWLTKKGVEDPLEFFYKECKVS